MLIALVFSLSLLSLTASLDRPLFSAGDAPRSTDLSRVEDRTRLEFETLLPLSHHERRGQSIRRALCCVYVASFWGQPRRWLTLEVLQDDLDISASRSRTQGPVPVQGLREACCSSLGFQFPLLWFLLVCGCQIFLSRSYTYLVSV